MNIIWFSGVWILPITGALGWAIAAIARSIRSLGTMLNGESSPPYAQGETIAGIVITIVPWLILLLVHVVQKLFGKTDFKPKLGKDPSSRSKDKLRAMSPPVPPEYCSSKPDGWTIGRTGKKYVRFPVDKWNIKHLYINGSPGSAKSKTIENGLEWNFNHAAPEQKKTFFCNDIKPELAFDTVVYDPSDPNCKIRCINPAAAASYYFGWDIYHGLSKDSTDDELEERMDMIARSLIPMPKSGDGGTSENSVFYSMATDIMVADLLYGFLTGKSFMDSMLQLMNVSLKDLTSEILASPLCDEHPKLRMYLQEYEDDESEMLVDSKHTMKENLRVFSNASVQYLFRDAPHMTSPEDLLNGISIFLQLPDNLLSQYCAIVNLIWQDVLKTLMAVPQIERDENSQIISLVCDEFGSCGYLPISDFMARCRSRLYEVILVAQGTSQLEETYGRAGARTLLQNCESKIILGSTDDEANEKFAKMAGYYRETMVSQHRNGLSGIKSNSQSVSDQYRQIYDPADFAQLRREKKIICFTDGYHMYIDKAPIFAIPTLKKESKEIKKKNREIMKREGLI